MKNILCYGDSNTWGAIPGTLKRHPYHVRWTGVLAELLGEEYFIIEDGINGRRTVWDDPANQCRNGLSGLGYSLYRAKPLDLVVLMLGTNDLNHTDAVGYYEGIQMLAKRILAAKESFPGTSDVFETEAKLLLVSPITLHPEMAHYEESLKFAEYTGKVAEQLQIPWLDAAVYAQASEADGCHMNADNHRRLGEAIAKKVRELV
jgi:lysophospholipase L1-like esterase